jgi:hypothetical protein
VTPGNSGTRALTAANCSQVRSSATETGVKRGLLTRSRLIWRRLLSLIGTSSARVSKVASRSVIWSRAIITRKLPRFEARTTPLRSRMMPRGGMTTRALYWLSAAALRYWAFWISCSCASRPESAPSAAPVTPPIRKARRVKTPCRSLTSLKKICGPVMACGP